MNSSYVTYLIVENDLVEKLHWTQYESAQDHFLILLHRYKDNQIQMVSITCWVGDSDEDDFDEYLGIPEYRFQNNISFQLDNTIYRPFVWTWLKNEQNQPIWAAIPVEDFLAKVNFFRIEMET